MSVHERKTKRGKVYDVKWRNATGRQVSESYPRRRDAVDRDAEIKISRRTGALARLDGGTETLDAYFEGTFFPVHVVPLAEKTRELYAGLYDGHVSPWLGGYPLRELTAEAIGRWQADRIAAGAPIESTRKAFTLIGAILQRALEARRVPTNEQRLVRRVAPAASDEVRPIAPVTIEAIRARLTPRGAILVSLLAYAGIRPEEALLLLWRHVLENTLVIHAPKTRRYRTQPRSVRLLAPLAQDLREWRMASGRPGDDEPVLLADRGGGAWTEPGYERWRQTGWRRTLGELGLAYQRPYDCRHSFASLLLHEGRSVVYVARQLGHSTAVCMRTYGHVVEELEDAPRIGAEEAIAAARRGERVRYLFDRGL